MIRIVQLMLLVLFSQQSVFAVPVSADDISSYVRMHANDAVKWQQWDESVLQQAQKENKLILISSGYYACHWCHVMRRESFNDAEVAKIINNHFIPVKIDRELQPVLDDYLMGFMKNTQGYGGWPLNIFITPQGFPLTGLVYLPKKDFIKVLNNLKNKWQLEQAKLEEIAREAFNYTEMLNAQQIYVTHQELSDALEQEVKNSMDELEGGFGMRAKFPMPHLMLSLLEIYKIQQQPWMKDFLQLTLQQMSSKGLHDAVGGGFFRYTVDPGWNVPHFEKMLYTNAAMIQLYSRAYKVLGDEKWLWLAEETMEFLLREMSDGKGGFVSALNAQDSHDEEGGMYIWSEEELEKSLGEKKYHWYKKNIKNNFIESEQKLLPVGVWNGKEASEVKDSLLKKRIKNPALRDDKFVISWNAYTLKAITELLRVKPDSRYRQAAERLSKRIIQEHERWLGDPSKASVYLQDYVFMADALWRWQALSVSRDETRSFIITDEVFSRFISRNGWYLSSDSILPMPGAVRNIKDDNLPASDVVMMQLVRSMPEKYSSRLLKLYGEDGLMDSRVVIEPLHYASFIADRLIQQGE